MTTPIDRIATRLREKLAAETTAAIARKAKLLTKHADQLSALAKSDGEKRAAIVAPYSVEVRKMAALATDPVATERVTGFVTSNGKVVADG